jgi:hypothetical protein
MQNSAVGTQLIKVNPLWWAVWTLAYGFLIIMCFFLAGFISYLVVGESDAALPAFALLVALIARIPLGLGQYGLLRLRRIDPPLIPWLMSTTAPLVLGMVLVISGLHSWLLSGLIIGGLMGLTQWMFLRATLQAAGLWMVVTLVPWIFLTAAFNAYSR